jgi:hypothetical protein
MDITETIIPITVTIILITVTTTLIVSNKILTFLMRFPHRHPSSHARELVVSLQSKRRTAIRYG